MSRITGAAAVRLFWNQGEVRLPAWESAQIRTRHRYQATVPLHDDDALNDSHDDHDDDNHDALNDNDDDFVDRLTLMIESLAPSNLLSSTLQSVSLALRCCFLAILTYYYNTDNTCKPLLTVSSNHCLYLQTFKPASRQSRSTNTDEGAIEGEIDTQAELFG